MAVICGRCLIQKHMYCEKQLVDLIDVSLPSIDQLNEFIHELEDILSDAQCLEKKVNVSKENNNSAKEENFKAVRNFRKDIEHYLDKLQSNVENEITQCHANNESILTAQLKTCLYIKETALMKQQQIDSIAKKNLQSTLYVTTENSRPEIATLKQTLNEASRKPMGQIYEFQINENLILTETLFGTVEDLQNKQPLMTYDGGAENTAPQSDTAPQVGEQKSFISTQMQKLPIKGETWYVLATKWFKQWKSYVGYDSWDNYNAGDESANPGPIDNSPLLKMDTKTLKKHLIDDLNYTLVPFEAWTALVSWYSITDNQEPLPRKVIEEHGFFKSLKVEVYRRRLKLCDNASQNDHIVKEFSCSDTIGYLKTEMMQVFNIKSDIEFRLWSRYTNNMYKPLNKEKDTLEDAGLFSGLVVVIEQKNLDGTWPRDHLRDSNDCASVRKPRRRVTRRIH